MGKPFCRPMIFNLVGGESQYRFGFWISILSLDSWLREIQGCPLTKFTCRACRLLVSILKGAVWGVGRLTLPRLAP